jgi:two-component system, response regulator, stage 0 sporulation protein F
MINDYLSKGKVLIADDDDDSREMLSMLLNFEGWEVEEAKDGKEALEKVVQYQPDLLILDNRMPELTGVEVYQQIQLQKIDTTVIFATAYGEIEELALSLGITYYINKPYDPVNLLAIMDYAYANAANSR